MIRIFLGISVLAWAGYGLYCFIDPASLATTAGVAVTSATGHTELSAMYGGVQIALGALAGYALIRPGLQSSVLLTLAFVTGGLFAARLIAALPAAEFSSYTVGALLFESVYTVIAIALLRRSQHRGAASPR